MALACGAAVGNLYLCQPLLPVIARDFGVAVGAVGMVPAATQLGYAAGILLLVPLIDSVAPARLVRWLLGLSSGGLFLAALAPGLTSLAAAGLLVGVFTVTAQVLISMSPSLSDPRGRGRAVGTLVSGLILGILLSRAGSGAVAQLAGTWRAAYVTAGALTLGLMVVLPGFLPTLPGRGEALRYRALMSSLPGLLRHQPLRQSMGINFFGYAAFSAIWADLAPHLASPPFLLGPAAIGLFGLFGAPGAILAPLAGRLADRWGSNRVNLAGLTSISAALLLAGSLGRHSSLAIIAALNFLDFGQQCGQVANQARIFRAHESASGRLNTLYMAASFSGGALGSLFGSLIMGRGGWPYVCVFGLVLVCCAAAVLARGALLGRRLDQG